MGKLKSFWDVISHRWRNAMPKFFKRVLWIACSVGGIALAVQTAIVSGGAQPHEWWNEVYPYLLGISGGAAFIAKLTQQYDSNGKPIEEKKEKENTVLDHDNF